MTTRYPAHTLTHSDTRFVFAEVAGRMHVSEWFGDDLRDIQVTTRREARVRWRSLIRAGATCTERGGSVSPLYLGLSRDHVPPDARREAWSDAGVADPTIAK